MLGIILYEAVDLVYNVGKIGVNGVYGAYRWYYNIPDEKELKELEKDKKIEKLEEQMRMMEHKYQVLEKLIIIHNPNIVMIQDSQPDTNQVLMIEDI